MTSIVVVGSINMDLVVQTRQLPLPGETVLGDALLFIPGGKGANQAVAAARLGCPVSMVGKVGMDEFGPSLIENLKTSGVKTSAIEVDQESSSGTAVIIVSDKGENQIVVSPAVNGKVDADFVAAHENLLASAALIALQFEIPIPSIEKTLEIARKHHIKTIINTAPYTKTPQGFFAGVDILVSNEVEAGSLTGIEIRSVATAKQAAEKMLSQEGVSTAIITLGAAGSVLAQGNEVIHYPAFAINPADTTAAGDAFIGGLIAAYTQGVSNLEMLRYANAVGAITATRLGAQPSLPTKEEVEAFLLTAKLKKLD